jgi:hypothetical protein
MSYLEANSNDTPHLCTPDPNDSYDPNAELFLIIDKNLQIGPGNILT